MRLGLHHSSQHSIAKRQTASLYLKQLCDIEVLSEQQVGKEKLFVHPKLMALLTKTPNDFKPPTLGRSK